MDVAVRVVVVTLAALLVFAAVRKLSHRDQVVASYARVGVPERLLDPLAAILLAGAGGLLLGLWWEWLGVVASAGVGVYFLAAIVAHVRARQFASIGTPIVLEGLAVAALVLWFS